MLRLLQTLCLASLILACGRKNALPKVPPNIISEDTMAAILYDLHLVNAAIKTGQAPYRDEKEVLREVLAAYNMDTATFNTGYRFYSDNERLMEHLYKQLHAKILEEQEQAEKISTSENQ